MDFLQHELSHVLSSLRNFELTPWKAVGFLGSVMFTSRWFVQVYYTRKLKRVVMPLSFWWLSVIGSALLLSYFIFGKNDSVGILSNFFPAFVSIYNLVVHMREVKSRSLVESEV
ncbi:lipid-A-disaccharide synthase N-terminal domain-containing protein [Dyella silvae]|uniref:lipid-A-disaccharide synthase N-terminal domain-containing protein n=1 Tax=Dyella silvae TaxID=2994424 RepID=UPI0022645E88|nr:lipid-A-disaccharide synthase N-terminal domain-containing protein [Dyella silvae]